MNIVELSNASRYESESSGPTTWAGRRFGKASPSGLAALLLACSFLLLLASQWFPLVRSSVDTAIFNSDQFGLPRKSANMADAETVVQIPYYLIWLVVFVLAGALVFAPRTRRYMFFGAAAGALGVQALVVVPILRAPIMIVNGDPDGSAGVTMHYESGTFFLIGAFVVLAATMVVAVSGRILPPADADRLDADIDPDAPDVAAPRPSMHDALAESVPDHGGGDADIEFGWSSRRAEVVDGYELDEPVDQASPEDHDQYRRPVNNPVG